MTAEELLEMCRCGETTRVQFRESYTSPKKMAAELVAFANTRGGVVLFGVEDKTGELLGLSYEEIQEISREMANVANEIVRPTIYLNTEVVVAKEKRVLVCSVSEGGNKPYKTTDGDIWVKQGSDKRRITENIEILSLFQESGNFIPDVEPVRDTSLSDLDYYALDEYLKKVYSGILTSFGNRAEQVLKNIHILHKSGSLTLSGYLFFARNPQQQCPTYMVKAVSFFGNDLGGSHYRDSKEITGNMMQLYEKSISFLKSNMHSVQEAGKSFNTLGKLEIDEAILEEVVQNALIHRDYLRSAPIRILIFDNRVEIISPGALAGGLTEDDIRNGKTYQRNPHLAVLATNALRYHGIGSGIVRILGERKDIVITNDESGQEFKVTIPRYGYHYNNENQESKSTPECNESENPFYRYFTQTYTF